MRNFGLAIRLGVILAAAIATWTAPPTGYLSHTKAETITSQINVQLLNNVVGGQALRADLKSTSLQLATLMIVPSPKLDWPSQRRSSQQELLDLSLAELRGGKAALPPVFLNRFPAELISLNSPQSRKDIFIKTVLPLVLRANSEVWLERQRMLVLIQRAQENFAANDLTPSERAFLSRLATEYEVSESDLAKLRQRVDVVPTSLALAQGAEESGWGTSRFARLGNAVFGQRTFRKGAGLVPLRREQGKRHEVKAFNNLYRSVRAYVWNLNTHLAYKKFREKRAFFRDRGLPLDGYALTGTLDRYSERGQNYIRTIRIIIRHNRLDEFDDMRLLLSLIHI